MKSQNNLHSGIETETKYLASMFDNVPDPDPSWAALHPDRALALLYIAPRPCVALDELIARSAH